MSSKANRGYLDGWDAATEDHRFDEPDHRDLSGRCDDYRDGYHAGYAASLAALRDADRYQTRLDAGAFA